MMQTRRLGALALTVFLSGPAGSAAQIAPDVLDLEDALAAAVEAHPLISAALANVDRARASVDIENAARYPTLVLDGSFVRYAEPMVVTPIHGFEPDRIPPFNRTLVQSVARATYTVWDGGVRSGRVRSAEASATSADSGLDDAEASVLEATGVAFFRVLMSEAELSANARRVAALERELSRVAQLEEVGRAARLDVLRVEAALAEARARETQAVAETRVARSSLARWMGRTPEQIEGVTLAAPTGVPSMPEEPPRLRRDAVERNLMLRDLRAAVDASQAQVGAARGSRLPQLALAGSIYEQGSVDGDFVTEWNVGVRVSLPVFTGGALGSTVERAEASHRGAVATLQASELRVAEQVDRGLAELESALSQSESLAVAVARAEEVVRIERLRVENEQATQSDYLDAEASLLMARAGLARARYGAWISRIRLDRTLGRLEHAAMVLDFGGER